MRRIFSNLNPKYVLLGIVVVLVIGIIGYMALGKLAVQENDAVSSSEKTPISKPVTPKQPNPIIQTLEKEIMVTNGQKHLVPLEKIKSGGPPRDGIPSIDKPQFTGTPNETHIGEDDVVLGLEINGDARAYPLSILVWHEIVNDIVGGVPVAVTYCPLCYTNQVFERELNGTAVEFGTSGKLYNSNLVMYDRMTKSYWSQALGTAIKGDLTGHTLDIVPFDVIKWKDWKRLHPKTVVLTPETGYVRAYGVDPYGDYYTDPRIMFPVDNKDDRMHPKEAVLGFSHSGIYKAYKQQDVEASIVINDKINQKPILLVSLFEGNARIFDRTVDGDVLEFDYVDEKIIDTQTNSEWNYDGHAVSGPLKGKNLTRLGFSPGFWFEWAAFHPDTQVYGESQRDL